MFLSFFSKKQSRIRIRTKAEEHWTIILWKKEYFLIYFFYLTALFVFIFGCHAFLFSYLLLSVILNEINGTPITSFIRGVPVWSGVSLVGTDNVAFNRLKLSVHIWKFGSLLFISNKLYYYYYWTDVTINDYKGRLLP